MFVGTNEQLINALKAMPIRGGVAGQQVALAAADEIARLTAELAQARAEEAAAYERAAQVAYNRESHAKGETARACRGIAVSIGMLATEAETAALSEIVKKAVDAETLACADICEEYSKDHGSGMFDRHSAACANAILARIDQRKGAGE